MAVGRSLNPSELVFSAGGRNVEDSPGPGSTQVMRALGMTGGGCPFAGVPGQRSAARPDGIAHAVPPAAVQTGHSQDRE